MKCVPNFENNSWKVKNLDIFYNFSLRRVKKKKKIRKIKLRSSQYYKVNTTKYSIKKYIK